MFSNYFNVHTFEHCPGDERKRKLVEGRRMSKMKTARPFVSAGMKAKLCSPLAFFILTLSCVSCVKLSAQTSMSRRGLPHQHLLGLRGGAAKPVVPIAAASSYLHGEAGRVPGTQVLVLLKYFPLQSIPGTFRKYPRSEMPKVPATFPVDGPSRIETGGS